MKFQEGRFIVKIRGNRSTLQEVFIFLKISFVNGKWVMKADNGAVQEIDESIRDNILQDFEMVAELRQDYRPAFNKVKVTIEAESDRGSKHVWSAVNGVALEKLLKTFPGLVDAFWIDRHRREKIHHYLHARSHGPKKDPNKMSPWSSTKRQ